MSLYNCPVSEESEYNFAIDIITYWLSNDTTDKKQFLNYVLSVIKTDLITFYQAQQFYKEDCCHISHIMPIITYSEDGKELDLLSKNHDKIVDLSSDDVLTTPWKMTRLVSHINRLRDEPFIEHTGNHQAIYYPIIELCRITNGYHSTAVGKYYKKGTVTSYTYDMKKALKFITTDGAYWYHKYNCNIKQKLFDYRIGILYYIASQLNTTE